MTKSKQKIKVKTKNNLFILFILMSVIFFACSKQRSILIASLFQHNAEGWTISGDAQKAHVKASYSPDGGATGGHIHATDDVTGGTWYFKAPHEYLGDKSKLYNATLTFNLRQKSALSDQFEDTDVIIKNGNNEISFKLPRHPDSTWTSYSIKINENAGWVNGDYDSKDTASKADIESVLAHVTGFFIRGEYESGPDTGALDNVKIEK